MSKKNKRIARKEFVSPRQELKESKRVTAKDLLGGQLLSRDSVIKQIPFALFLFAMLLFYIANQYRGQRIMKEIIALEREVKGLSAEAITTTFKLQEMSKQSAVIKMIKENEMELEEALIPPYKIVIEN